MMLWVLCVRTCNSKTLACRMRLYSSQQAGRLRIIWISISLHKPCQFTHLPAKYINLLILFSAVCNNLNKSLLMKWCKVFWECRMENKQKTSATRNCISVFASLNMATTSLCLTEKQFLSHHSLKPLSSSVWQLSLLTSWHLALCLTVV